MLKVSPERCFTSLALLLAMAYLSGCGLPGRSNVTAAAQPHSQHHKVILNWSPEPSNHGYYVYRGGQSGGPFTKISGLQPASSYTDTTVSSGQTYYYVVTTLNPGNQESGYSNEVQAVIPTP
jgi:fibronectin type 3 domain-containing protein